MKRYILLPLLLSATLLSGESASFAQAGSPVREGSSWTLEECIRHALDNNISVKQHALAVEQNEIQLNTARNSRLPDLSGSASQNWSFGRGLTADNTYANSNTGNTSLSLGSTAALYSGSRIRHQIRQGELNLKASTADLDKMKDDIRVAVTQAYFQILYNQGYYEIALRKVEIDSLQVERVAAMYEAGKASAAELAQQQASLGNSILSATQALNNLNLSVLDLAQLLELPTPEGFAIAPISLEDNVSALLPSPEEVYAEALEIRPAILAEDYRIRSQAEGVSIAKAGFLPSLYLSGGIGTNYYTASGYQSNSFGDQIKNNFSQYIGLTLSVPVFNRFSTRNSVRQASLALKNQELQSESARKSLYKEIQQVYYQAVASQEKLSAATRVLSGAKESYDLVSAKYENGKAGITEFNEARNNYLEAETNLLQARYEEIFQANLLHFYRTPPRP